MLRYIFLICFSLMMGSCASTHNNVLTKLNLITICEDTGMFTRQCVSRVFDDDDRVYDIIFPKAKKWDFVNKFGFFDTIDQQTAGNHAIKLCRDIGTKLVSYELVSEYTLGIRSETILYVNCSKLNIIQELDARE